MIIGVVTGPTAPGTGVIRRASGPTSWWSTSPSMPLWRNVNPDICHHRPLPYEACCKETRMSNSDAHNIRPLVIVSMERVLEWQIIIVPASVSRRQRGFLPRGCGQLRPLPCQQGPSRHCVASRAVYVQCLFVD